MLVKYKLNAKDTLATVLKKHKLKDKDKAAIAKLPKNASLMKRIKSLDKIKPGDEIWLLDPNAKYYVFKHGGKTTVLSETEWKDVQKQAAKNLKTAVTAAQSKFDVFDAEYKAQVKAVLEFPVISFFTETWIGDKGKIPNAERRAALNALKALQGAVAGSDFKKIVEALKSAETVISTYGKGVKEWREKQLGSAQNWATGLTIYREASYVFLGALAMTAAAPASAGVAMKYGAAVGLGSGGLKALLNELGRAGAGEKVTAGSTSAEIFKGMMLGAGAGALGAGAAASMGKMAVPGLGAALRKGNVTQPLVKNVFQKSPVGRKLMEKWLGDNFLPLQAEAMRAIGSTASKGAPDALKTAVRAHIGNKAMEWACETAVKNIIGMGASSIKSTLVTVLSKEHNRKKIMDYLKKALSKPVAKKTEQQYADDLAAYLQKSELMSELVETLIRDNTALLEKEFVALAMADLKKNVPNLAKQAKKR